MDVLFARLMAMIASALSGDGSSSPVKDFMAFATQEEPASERKVHPNTAWFDRAWANAHSDGEAAKMAEDMGEEWAQ